MSSHLKYNELNYWGFQVLILLQEELWSICSLRMYELSKVWDLRRHKSHFDEPHVDLFRHSICHLQYNLIYKNSIIQ